MKSMANKLGEADQVKITVLMDNCAGHGLMDILAQHGISMLVEAASGEIVRRILFDAGSNAAPILSNMKQLNIDPGCIDMIVLSHRHQDHTSGLLGILEQIDREVLVVAHSSCFNKSFKSEPSLRNTGMIAANTREAIERLGGQILLVDEPLRLMSGVITTGTIERTTDFEFQTNAGYHIDDGKIVYEELLDDDISLVVNIKEKGLFIITGCSHSGIVNIARHSMKMTGIGNIHGIIGGFHLVDADGIRIDNTINCLKELNLQKLVPGHCTGFNAVNRLAARFGDVLEPLYAGKVMVV